MDIETAKWDRFVVAATIDRGGVERIHRSIGALVDHLIAAGGTWWAHNGGAFDALAIAEELRRRGISASISLAGARVSRLQAAGFTLCDSYSLIPMPLERAAGLAVGVHAPTLGLPCTCGKACGGYCALRPGRSSPQVDAYCLADCRTLLSVLDWLEVFAGRIGLQLRGTLGGTAWATAAGELDLPDADLPPATWRRARLAYYGGRVTVARPSATGPGSHWDISGAYPAALAATSLPIGEWREVGAEVAASCHRRARPGIYAAIVSVPDMHLPPLPWRTPKDAVAYPIGTVAGVWALPELDQAEARGCKIERIGWGIIWEDSAPIFRELVTGWHRIRVAVGKHTARGELMRLLSNSLTGKLAESPERRGVSMFPREIRYCLAKAPCTVARCSGRCGAMDQLDLGGQIWGVPYFRPSPSSHVAWASYLTAATREVWMDGAESQGLDLVYGDTDSVWTTGAAGPSPQGAALGRWSYKHAWSTFEAAAPKTYRYRDPGDSADTVRTAGGQAITLDDWKRGAASQDEGAVAFLSAAASGRGLFQRRRGTWRKPGSAAWYGDRQLDPDANVTRPSTCEQIRQKTTG